MTVKNPYIPPNYGMVSPEIERLKAEEDQAAPATEQTEEAPVAKPAKRKGK